ncbi:hypothetical protein [Algivirga pacifica]
MSEKYKDLSAKERAIKEFSFLSKELSSLILKREEEEKAEAMIKKINEIRASLATSERVGTNYSSIQLKKMLEEVTETFKQNVEIDKDKG